MFSYVRLSDGGDPAVEGSLRSEVDIVASLAERVLPKGRFDWAQLHSHEALRRGMARVVPGYTPVADIGTTQAEFQIPGRTFHEPYFATDDKRARFHVTAVPDMALDPDEFLLMTIRSEGQFNTVVYEEYDLYRGADRRDAVLMSAIDASRLGVEDGQRVKLSSKAGEMDASVCIVDIAAGSMAAYFPEANILVERRLDRRSKTPAFKATRIRVHAL
jgi:anaerobic selenocysteine-containing dehydrogenase